jgi:periplasmic mercuric ion binding protein
VRYILAIISLALMISAAAAGERTVTLKIENMTCVACPYIVELTLAAVPGVIHAKVSFENKTATVTFDDSRTDIPALTMATENAGYPSQLLTTPGG